jgi:predicted ATPase
LLAALGQNEFAIVEEPGRRIIREEQALDGNALPWIDSIAFAKRAIDVSLNDLSGQERSVGPVLFDCGLVDAVAALQHFSGEPLDRELCIANRYNILVFVAPPWSEIYVRDEERRHSYAEALAEYDRLERIYSELGYDIVTLPKASVAERVNFVAVTPLLRSRTAMTVKSGRRIHKNKAALLAIATI